MSMAFLIVHLAVNLVANMQSREQATYKYATIRLA